MIGVEPEGAILITNIEDDEVQAEIGLIAIESQDRTVYAKRGLGRTHGAKLYEHRDVHVRGKQIPRSLREFGMTEPRLACGWELVRPETLRLPGTAACISRERR